MIVAFMIFVLILSWTGYWMILKGQLPISDRALMVLGTLLMTLSVLMPFMILMKVLESTFFLNFLSYEFMLLGMMFFVFGIGGFGRYQAPLVRVADLADYRQGLLRLKKRSEI